MKARIYKKTKSAMQSGRAGLGRWILELEPSTAKAPEPLMGWTACGDTNGQVGLSFPTLEAAQSYARGQGLEASVTDSTPRRVKPRNFSDNFRYVPPEDGENS